MEYYRIACVARPHGVQGGVKLQPLTDNVSRFKGMREAYLEEGGAYRPVRLSDIGVQPDAVTLHIEGVNTREQAEALRVAAGRLEEIEGTHDVREDELGGPLDGAVHVALRREVTHGVDAVVGEDLVHALEAADVLPQEYVAAGESCFEIAQVFGVAGVGQLVDVDDTAREACLFEQVADEVAADETAAAGDE
jgi:hypothetical protein